MSNLSDINTDSNNASHNDVSNVSAAAIAADSHAVNTATADPRSSRIAKSSRWSFIQNDLSKAMDTWQKLEKAEISLSPEEEQLAKIKTIISQLKQKLEQF